MWQLASKHYHCPDSWGLFTEITTELFFIMLCLALKMLAIVSIRLDKRAQDKKKFE